MSRQELIGSVRRIPYGPLIQVLSVEGDEVLVAFIESAHDDDVCNLSLEEVLAMPLAE